MLHRALRWFLLVAVSIAAGLGLALIWSATSGGVDSTLRMVHGNALEVQRWAGVVLANVSPFGPGEEDYRVYNAALQAWFDGVHNIASPVYLMTDWPKHVRPVPGSRTGCFDNGGPSQELVSEFSSRNRFRWGLSARPDVERLAGLLRPSEKASRELGGPIEHVVLSRVAYDRSGDRALVYLAHYCGLCGGGSYILLRRAGNSWSVEDGCLMWVS